MSKAIVDAAELRRFAQDLKRFNNDLQHQMSVMHTRMINLGQTWRDQEHRKFSEEFEATMKVLKRFTESSNQHIPFLLRKADRIDEYLQQR
ncbi:MAG: hypothetical protein KDA25_09455 [Phycisphaerales bacterium]|nr:hypothetical protein [Phycisphaerales bacterium]